MKKSNSSILEFTTKFINSNFRIKVFGRTEDGKKLNTLVGVSGILKLIGAELFNKFIKRALKAGMDACRCALFREYKKTDNFYPHWVRQGYFKTEFACLGLNCTTEYWIEKY